ncbi:T9SS type A sorting domain-containing protein, partial [Winogradskyella aurantia]
TSIVDGTAPFTGQFRPEEPLSTFNGVDADGTWTLNFCDSANGDTGTFNSWAITFAPAPSCLAPTAPTGTVLTATTAELSWTAGGTETLWDVEVVDITGGGSATGTPTDSGVSNPYMAMGLTEGNDYEYYVRADCGGANGVSGWTGPFAWTQNVPPPNDFPAGAIPITPSPEGTGCASPTFTLPFSTDFTTDSGAQGGCSDSGLDQFFSWTATTDGLTFSSAAPGNPGIVVWDANTLTEIDCANTFATDVILSGWTIGQDLVIQIYDFDGSVSDVAFCLEEYTFPTAPNCAETPISPADGAVDVVVTGGLVTLTWTAPSSGPAPTDYVIFFGDTSGALNDLGPVGGIDTTIDITGIDFSTTYFWQVVPQNGASLATGCPEWSFTTEVAPPPPANDDCANATVVSAPSTTAFDTSTATATGPTANCGTLPGGPNVWFEYTATGAGDLTVSTCDDASFDTKINVYSGTCGALVCEGGNDDGTGCGGFTSELTLTGLAAGTYYIAVSGFSGATGTGNLTLDFSLSDGPDLDSPTSFTYYPNPVENTLTLSAALNNIDDVVMFNMLGQQVMRVQPNALSSELDMTNMQTGTYFVKVTIADTTQTIRVVKQ